MTHYFCAGSCRGVMRNPGFCTVPECTQYEEPLEPCDCTEERHDPDREKTPEDIEREEAES